MNGLISEVRLEGQWDEVTGKSTEIRGRLLEPPFHEQKIGIVSLRGSEPSEADPPSLTQLE